MGGHFNGDMGILLHNHSNGNLLLHQLPDKGSPELVRGQMVQFAFVVTNIPLSNKTRYGICVPRVDFQHMNTKIPN